MSIGKPIIASISGEAHDIIKKQIVEVSKAEDYEELQKYYDICRLFK